MARYSRGLLAAVASATLAALAACSPPAATEPGPNPIDGSTTAAAAPNKPALPTNGKCVLITSEKAAALIGSVTSSSAVATGSEGIIHIDGCSFIGSPSSLGYDINNLSGGAVSAASVVTQAKTAMGAQPGVTPFDVTGGDASIGFTVAIGPKVMARIEVATGPYTIAVNSTAGDAETAKKISNGALAILLAAIG